MTATAPPTIDPPRTDTAATRPDLQSHMTHGDSRPPSDLPITVQTTFEVARGWTDAWFRIWENLARCAAAWPGYRAFHMVPDSSGGSRPSVISVWDDMDAYLRYMRASGIIWIERDLSHAYVRGETRISHASGSEGTAAQTSRAPSDLPAPQTA